MTSILCQREPVRGLPAPLALRALHRHRGAGAGANELALVSGDCVDDRAQEPANDSTLVAAGLYPSRGARARLFDALFSTKGASLS
jgi:hypothetical protein